jgi:hypothetical protein
MPGKKDQEVYLILGDEERLRPEVSDQEPDEPSPSYGEIAQRAFELYLARGASHGHDVEDWLAAERELKGS